MTAITEYLEDVREGFPGAKDKLFIEVYGTLRQIAASRLGGQDSLATMHPTELVNEAWLKMGGEGNGEWQNRKDFVAAAAEAMRRSLVENARKKKERQQGHSDASQCRLSDHEPIVNQPAEELLHLDEALTALEDVDPVKAQVVKLKFFCAMTIDEIAVATQLSHATVERYWAFSRVWLHQRMGNGEPLRASC